MPVSLERLRANLGISRAELPDSATDDQINAVLQRRAEKKGTTMSIGRPKQADGDAAIDRAIAERKIPEDRRAHYQMEFSRNPEGTIALLERLEAAPVTVYASTPAPAQDDSEPYPADWLKDSERRSIAAAEAGEEPRSRVVLEQ